MERIIVAVDRPEFWAGLRWGAVALGIGLLIYVVLRRERRPFPVVGLLVAGAFTAGLWQMGSLMPGVAIGIPLLAAAGLLARLTGLPVNTSWLLALPGAVFLVIGAGVDPNPWLRVIAVVVVLAGGALAVRFEQGHRSYSQGPVLYAISVAGVFVTVPETERALILLGVALPLALLAWPFNLGALGVGGAYAAVGALVWTVVYDGVHRPSAVVGGLATLGLLAIEPLGRVLAGRRTALGASRRGLALALGHLALVFVVARVAGLANSGRHALVIAGLALGAALAVLVLMHEPHEIRPAGSLE